MADYGRIANFYSSTPIYASGPGVAFTINDIVGKLVFRSNTSGVGAAVSSATELRQWIRALPSGRLMLPDVWQVGEGAISPIWTDLRSGNRLRISILNQQATAPVAVMVLSVTPQTRIISAEQEIRLESPDHTALVGPSGAWETEPTETGELAGRRTVLEADTSDGAGFVRVPPQAEAFSFWCAPRSSVTDSDALKVDLGGAVALSDDVRAAIEARYDSRFFTSGASVQYAGRIWSVASLTTSDNERTVLMDLRL